MVMDSLRLLTRGSGFKATSLSSRPSGGQQASNGIKRKRSEYEADFKDSHKHQELTVDEIRSLHKKHNIAISDLRALLNQQDGESRKERKVASRIFPQPLQRFSGLRAKGVNHALLSNLAEQGYYEPTEVQLATIPLLMPDDGQVPDLLTVAPTGSGKTLAFLIPLIDRLSKAHLEDKSAQRQVSAIILGPTKELVNQIVNEGRKLAARTGVRITAFKKGMKLHEDMSAVEDEQSDESKDDQRPEGTVVKADIIVSTPLSLLNAIRPSSPAEPLPMPDIHDLILDEADVLLDALFRDQTLSIWSACTHPSLRTSLWSATIGSNIEELTSSTITSRQLRLSIATKNRPPLFRCVIGLKDSSLPNITHKLTYAGTEAGKLTGLRQLVRPPSSHITVTTKSSAVAIPEARLRLPFLIFTQTIPRAQALYEELKYDVPPAATSDGEAVERIAILHASLPTHQREQIMTNFRLGKTWILITTDLLSRGIDFKGVNGVINYDIPTTSASYVHRAGRTGRAGREGGACVTFYTKDDVAYLRPIVNVINKSQKLHGINGEQAESQVPKWLLDALPHVTKQKKKELKERGVDVRRAVKESDDKQERRRKARNLVGTKSGYERKLEDRRKGMIEGSRRRSERQHQEDGMEDDFDGFD